MLLILPATHLPQSSEGFYSIYNPFQTDGPNGYTERRMIGPRVKDIFVRTDFPGIGQDNVRVTIGEDKKGLIINAEEPRLKIHHIHPVPRIYKTYILLYCDCCEISSFRNLQVTDGVLRVVISTTPINIGGVPVSPNQALHRAYDTDPKDPANTGYTVKPYVQQFPDHGPYMAYEYKQIPDGSAYVRLDMPGVPNDEFTTCVETGRVNVAGYASYLNQYESSDRYYSADAALLDTPVGTLPTPRLRSIVQNGVMHLMIHPV